MDEYENTKTFDNDYDRAVSSAFENSTITSNPVYGRTGLDANGYTREMDLAADDLIQKVSAKINDPARRDAVVADLLDKKTEQHAANVKYEMAELMKGSISQIETGFADERASLTEMAILHSNAENAHEDAARAKINSITDRGSELPKSLHGFNNDLNGYVNFRLKKLHKKAFDDFRLLGYTEDEAYAAASKATSGCFEGMIGDLTASGYTTTVDGLLKDKERDDATRVQIGVKDGNPVYDDTKYDPSGLLWCKRDSIGKMRDAWKSSITKQIYEIKRSKEEKEAITKDEVVSLRAIGDRICSKTVLNEKDLDSVLDKLSTIAIGSGEKTANEAYEHLITQRDKHQRIVKSAERVAEKLVSADQVNKMWDSYNANETASAANFIFSSGEKIDAGIVDVKKAMATVIRSALTNGIFKNDPNSNEGVWTKRLKELEEGITDNNRTEMLSALKSCGFSVHKSYTQKNKDTSDSLKTFLTRFASDEDIPIESTIKLNSNGELVPNHDGISYMWVDDNGVGYQVSGECMKTILEIMGASGRWYKTTIGIDPIGKDKSIPITPEDRKDIHNIIRKALYNNTRKGVNTDIVKDTSGWMWSSYGDRYIDSSKLRTRLTQLVIGDMQNDTAVKNNIEGRSIRDFVTIEKTK